MILDGMDSNAVPPELQVPQETELTANLDQFKLNPRSCHIHKYALLLMAEDREAIGKVYLFFQLTNHKSPEGEKL